MTFTGLYAILDVDAWRSRGIDVDAKLEAIADALLSARPSALQLRAKNEGGRATLEMLRRLRPRCTEVPLFANDRPDLAMLAKCDGVHVGQDDLPYEEVRRIVPREMMIGVSTHGPEQLAAALSLKPTYVAFGPVFGTKSKVNPDPMVGIAGLRASCARAKEAGIPIVAIGGIDRARAAEVVATGARWAAAISDLVDPEFAEVAR
ncbi:MAG: thiamine phosphate synthase, partial [Polyangiales bacterium]